MWILEVLMALVLTSPAFRDGAAIPPQHTCDGRDVSPALVWGGAPPGTATFALIADDPDAPGGTWVHWVIYNIPAHVTALPEGLETTQQPRAPAGALQGRNDFRRTGYGGPCPPPGRPHRYFFKLYALDATLPLRAGASKADVEQAMKGHVIAQAQMMGTYARRK